MTNRTGGLLALLAVWRFKKRGLAIGLAIAFACGAPIAGRPDRLSLAGAASRGELSYAVAFGPALLVSVELGSRFVLVTRSLGPGGALVERSRADLGPPDWDVADLAVVPGARLALVASAAGTVRTIDLASGRTIATWYLGAAATAVAVTPDGRLAATGSADGVVCLRRRADGALLQCLVATGGVISGLDFDPDGRRLASSSWDGRVEVWSVPALASLARLDAGGSANQVAFAPDGRFLAIAASGAPPRRTPEVAARERVGDGASDPAARVLVWQPRGGPARALRGHLGPVTAVAWSGRNLLSASWDRTVRLWDVESGREEARVSGFSHLLRDLAAAPGGRWAAAAGWAAGRDDPATVLLALRPSP